MRNAPLAMVVASSASLLLFPFLVASCVATGDDEPNTGGLGRYSSPTAVFDAFREASSKRDWGKCFSCLSPAAQDDVVFEMFFALAMSDSSQSRAICRKYGLDEASLNVSFKERLKERGGDAGASAASRREAVEVVRAAVRDKRGFYVAGRNFFDGKAPVPPLGDLEELVVDGDVARGRAKTTISHLESSGGASQSVTTEVYKTFNFRTLDGGWLIDPS